MTATEVGGVAVISDEPTPSPYLRDRAGNTVYWQRTRTLTLADGNVLYGCAECDYTHTSPNSIRPHLGAHTTGPRKPRRGSREAADVSGLSLAELLARVERMQRVEAERDGWRARALAAERSLAVLRKALRP